MVGENFLDEEEVLRKLKINKAQLEELIKEGKILPSYQEGIRKFKESEINQLLSSKEEVEAPPVEAPPISEPEKIKEETGSTRVIEPPKEAPKLRVKSMPKGETPEFLKEPAKTRVEVTMGDKITFLLLVLSLIVSLLAVIPLYFVWRGASIPGFLSSLVKALGSLGG